jgi:2-keto-3-deoxy-L-rhamnonate aldolase RhmA
MIQVDGLDCIMIGPDDLSQDLGVPGEMQSPVLQDAFEEVFATCRKRNVPFGLSCHSPALAQKWFGKGATWMPYQSDAAMVLNAARAAVPKLMEIGGRA